MSDLLPPAIDFDELANGLIPLGTLNSPSELQGLLCGKLCGGADLSEIAWLFEAVEFLDFTQAPDDATRELLSRLFFATRAQLAGEFGLKLMLPDDDTAMEERLSALSQWCHGFLTGFGSVGVKESLSEEARDALTDFASIVQISADDESDEADYAEVTEYVRLSASALFYEFGVEISLKPHTDEAPVIH